MEEETKKKEGVQADRGKPNLGIAENSQKIFVGVFFCVILAAMSYVFVNENMLGNKKQAMVKHEEIAFKTSGAASTPYIKPDTIDRKPETLTPMGPAVDPLALQREQMMQAEALRMAQERQKQLQKRLHSPQLVFDQSSSGPAAASALPSGGGGSLAGGDMGDTNLTFAAQAGAQGFETSRAVRMEHLDKLIPQGTMIAGILETAIQSDLPGMTRAVVSDDVYSFDGSTILIPKGSKIVGQYRSGLVRGQTRVFVIWNRLIRNDGVTISLGSYGTDALGRSGLDGEVDTHFFERFGSSVLLSMIDTSLQIVANNSRDSNASTVAVETGNDFNRAAEIALENSVAIPPTINVEQGKRINVFVGKDLDFSQVSQQTASTASP